MHHTCIICSCELPRDITRCLTPLSCGSAGHVHGGCIAAVLDQVRPRCPHFPLFITAVNMLLERARARIPGDLWLLPDVLQPQAVGWAGSIAHRNSAVVARVRVNAWPLLAHVLLNCCCCCALSAAAAAADAAAPNLMLHTFHARAFAAGHEHAAACAAAAAAPLHIMVTSNVTLPSRLSSRARRFRCTRIDGRKAYCSALLTSHPPLIPAQTFFRPRAPASNGSDSGSDEPQEDTPAFPDGTTVRRIVRVSGCSIVELVFAHVTRHTSHITYNCRFTRPAPPS